MKVLLFTNLYPSRRAPTRGVFNLHVFRALSQHCETRLIAPLPWWGAQRTAKDWFRVPYEQESGICAGYPTYWSLPKLHKLHGAGMYHSVRKQIRKLHREFPFEVILASWAYPDAYAAARIARDLNVPLVTNILGSDINALIETDVRPQIEFALRQSTKIIPVSRALGAKIVDMGVPESKIAVQHNGVDAAKFQLRDKQEIRRQLGIKHEGALVCYVGNFVGEKGVDVLVQSFRLLKEAGRTDIHLSLIGSGSLDPSLRATVQAHGMEQMVTFYGRRKHDEIPLWMAACDVFCLPSLREGCPNVILEALCSGRPVVASCVGGVPELLTEREGALVPPSDPNALKNGILATLSRAWNPNTLRQAVQGRSWDDVGYGYYRILEQAIWETNGTPLPSEQSKCLPDVLADRWGDPQRLM
jgi:glycosyltransferase involved in cell wall biosynthesis